MIEVLKKAKIPILIIILLFVGFVMYNFSSTKKESANGLSEQVVDKSTNKEFLPLLQLIKGVDFDDKFFNDKTFRSLIDFSQPVKEEKRGRDNPFSPDIITSLESNPNAPVLEASESDNKDATSTKALNLNTSTSSPKTIKTSN